MTKRKSRGAALIECLNPTTSKRNPNPNPNPYPNPNTTNELQGAQDHRKRKQPRADHTPRKQSKVHEAVAGHASPTPSGPLTSKPALTQEEVTWDTILQNFAALDVVLKTFHQRRQIPTFTRLKDTLQRLTRSSFSMSKLTYILAVQPDVYHLQWINTQGCDGRPVLDLAVHFPFSNSDTYADTHTSVELRRKSFSEALHAARLKHKTPRALELTCEHNLLIPPRPTSTSRAHAGGVVHRHLSAMKEVMTKLRSAPVCNDAGGVDMLEQLREGARMMEQISDTNTRTTEQAQAQAQKHGVTSHNLSLSRLCDCVRSHFVHLKRTNQPMDIAAKKISRTMGSVSSTSVREGVSVLASVVPEFCTILAPDCESAQEVLSVKLSNYTEIRRQVVAYENCSDPEHHLSSNPSPITPMVGATD